MLFVTFLQVPFADLRGAFARCRFLAALLTANFVGVPLLLAALLPFLPSDNLVRLGVLLAAGALRRLRGDVLADRAGRRPPAAGGHAHAPARADAAAACLSRGFPRDRRRGAGAARPFVHAFLWLIAVPLVLAAIVQHWAARSGGGETVLAALTVLPVLSTALVLFIVVAAVRPQLGPPWTQPAGRPDLHRVRRGGPAARLGHRAAVSPRGLCGTCRGVQHGYAQLPGRPAAGARCTWCDACVARNHRHADAGRGVQLVQRLEP